MKRTNKKGFTIVELVIVIAVIAILAAVLIPTFSGVIEKAEESANLQDATNTYKQLLTEEEYLGNLNLNKTAGEPDLYIVVGDDEVVYKVVDGEVTVATKTVAGEEVAIAKNEIVVATAGTAGAPYYKALTGNHTNVYVYAGEQTAA